MNAYLSNKKIIKVKYRGFHCAQIPWLNKNQKPKTDLSTSWANQLFWFLYLIVPTYCKMGRWLAN
jgi:hypothetical protein